MTKTVQALSYLIKNIPPNSQYKVLSYGSTAAWYTVPDPDFDAVGGKTSFFARDRVEVEKITQHI